MKKILALFLAALMLFMLVACKPAASADPTSTPVVDPTLPTNTPVEPTTPTNTPTEPTEPPVAKLTEEDVRSHPVSPVSDFTYVIEPAPEPLPGFEKGDDYVVITGYVGTEEIVVIPETIEGYKVTNIQAGAFDFFCSVRGLLIPSGIISLSNGTFLGCPFEVVIWDSAWNIGYEAFYGCQKMHTLVVGDNVAEVGEFVFMSCFELVIKLTPGSYMEQWCKDHDIDYRTE